MNRLQHETSPYLLQHAGNPVDWYAWKEEAFRRAREEDKPILVSIGYSTCHWCHVMERESFENDAIAEFMNTHFVNIKVDREERPDVDQIYMEACQAINGSGGWPLNVFLTPDRKPFFAGTYYPPEPAHQRPSWLQVLRRMVQAFKTQREVVEEQAEKLLDAVRRTDRVFLDEALALSGKPVAEAGSAERIAKGLLSQADRKEGGFGGAPKFPSTMSLRYLLEYHRYTGDADALAQVDLSLRKMVRGGLFDQLGGGFARYATDRAWLVPHFEKMLYDNALLVGLYADRYRIEADAEYGRAVADTLEFVRREMSHPEGGFYAALDADSEGVEGKFYVWEWPELKERLGEDLPLFSDYYGVSAEGNWEGRNILWRPRSDTAFAAEHELDAGQLADLREKWHGLLWPARTQRVRPGLDDKIILSWNALMVSGLARAGLAFPEKDYGDWAVQQLDFLLDTFQDEAGRWYHTYKDGRLQYPAFLEDLAFLIEALLETYQWDFDLDRIRQARDLTGLVLDQFLDEQENFFYFSNADQRDIPLRKKEVFDSALPSGNSTMAHNLLRLAVLTGEDRLQELADRLLRSMASASRKYPTSFSRWGRGLLYAERGTREVAISGPAFREQGRKMQESLFPGTVWMAANDQVEGYPLLEGRSPSDDTKIFVCKDYSCRLPVSQIDEARNLLEGATQNSTT